jgi:tetratricopeptide (TPR) repeat protein
MRLRFFGAQAIAILIGSAACTSTEQKPLIPTAPASSFQERESAALKNRPYAPVKNSKLDINAALKAQLRSPSSYKENLVNEGILAISLGNLPLALERANALWRSLDEERLRSADADLTSPEIRNAALLLALAQARSSRSPDTSLLERIIRANPLWEPAYVVHASLLVERGAFLLAERTTLAILDRIDTPSAIVFSLHATALRAQQKSSEARKVIARAHRAFPEDPLFRHWKGIFEYDDGHLEAACALFNQAYQVRQNDETLMHNHGVCLSRAGRWEEAASFAKMAISQFPLSPELRLLAGTVLKRGEDFAGAESAWRGFLDLAPENDKRRVIVEAALADLKTAGDIEAADPMPPH